MASQSTPEAFLNEASTYMIISSNTSQLSDGTLERYKQALSILNKFNIDARPQFTVDRDDLYLWQKVFSGQPYISFTVTPNDVRVSSQLNIDLNSIIQNATPDELSRLMSSVDETKKGVISFSYAVGGNSKGVIRSEYPFVDHLSSLFKKLSPAKNDRFAFYIEDNGLMWILQIRDYDIVSMSVIAPHMV